MSTRFYYPFPLTGQGVYPLPDRLIQYIVKVLRRKVGDELILFNGQGIEALASLKCEGKRWFAEIIQFEDISRESDLEITLVQALLTNEKMDLVIQKAVELGVKRIFPIMTQRSIIRLDANKLQKRYEHFHSIIASACEQCGRNHLPKLEEIQTLDQYLQQKVDFMQLVLAPGGEKHLSHLKKPERPIHILVGPEGGWSDEEMMKFEQSHIESITLGPRILRTETAGLTTLAVLQSQWGDL